MLTSGTAPEIIGNNSMYPRYRDCFQRSKRMQTGKLYKSNEEQQCVTDIYYRLLGDIIKRVTGELIPAMLDVDHIDGNSDNDVPENWQTLCANCHREKTMREGDHLTPSNSDTTPPSVVQRSLKLVDKC